MSVRIAAGVQAAGAGQAGAPDLGLPPPPSVWSWRLCLVLQQSEQKSPPQCRQWCRRRLSVKPFSQPEHAAWPSSAAHSRFVFAVAGAPTAVSSICSSSGCSCFRRFRRMAGPSHLQPDPSELRAIRHNAPTRAC